MQRHRFLIRFLMVAIFGSLAALAIASNVGNCTNPATAKRSDSNGKIPSTTASEEALKEFFAGRNLAERLLGQVAVFHKILTCTAISCSCYLIARP